MSWRDTVLCDGCSNDIGGSQLVLYYNYFTVTLLNPMQLKRVHKMKGDANVDFQNGN